MFGRDVAEIATRAREAAGIGHTEAIDATLSRVSRNAYGKLVMVLDNGQVWQQIDSTPLAPKDGSHVQIRRAALDSYFLSTAEGGKSIRVRRIR